MQMDEILSNIAFLFESPFDATHFSKPTSCYALHIAGMMRFLASRRDMKLFFKYTGIKSELY
jgi:hypothetical protein